MISIQTASSSHKKCFICHRRDRRLPRVSIKSIENAYLNHNIIIKEGTRSCYRHINLNRELLEDSYILIPTKPVAYNQKIVRLLNIVSNNVKNKNNLEENAFSSIFDPFKNLNTLDETHCYKITKWTKKQFIDFLGYIKNIRNTTNRTKSELVALYRFKKNYLDTKII